MIDESPKKNQKNKKIEPQSQQKQQNISQGTTSDILKNYTIVFSGQFSSISRDQIENLTKQLGAKCTKSVSGKTSILVHGHILEDGRSPQEGKKYKDALMKNVMIMNEEQFNTFLVENTGKTLSELQGGNKNDEIYKKYQKKDQKQSKIQDEDEAQQKQDENKQKETQLWTEKYQPQSVQQIIGNQKNIISIMDWLNNWEDVVLHKKKSEQQIKKPFYMYNKSAPTPPPNPAARACLLSGPPGVGKTSSVRLICKHMGYELLEWNASDVRNKKSVDELFSQLKCNNKVLTLGGKMKKLVVLMDEIDGMSSGDRGGITQIIKLIKESIFPIFCICNDRMNQKIRSLANNCFDVKFLPLQSQDVAKHLQVICQQENIKVDINQLQELCIKMGGDLRQLLNYLQFWKQSFKGGLKDKTVMLSNFEAATKLIQRFQFENYSLKEKIELFFVDYELIPLLIQENYLSSIEKKSVWSTHELEKLSKATSLIAESDILSTQIRSNQNWQLLPNYAFLSCIYPCDIICDNKPIFAKFPEWLGKYQSQRKNSRLLKELKFTLAGHISYSSKFALRNDYIPYLSNLIQKILLKKDVQKCLQVMDNYGIKPDHLKEHFNELCYPKGEFYGAVDSNVKSMLTKSYNKNFADSSSKINVGGDKKSKIKEEKELKFDKNIDDFVVEENEEEQNIEENNGVEEKNQLENAVQIKKGNNKGKSKNNGQNKIQLKQQNQKQMKKKRNNISEESSLSDESESSLNGFVVDDEFED